MLQLKHDIRINLKREKEVLRCVRLLVCTTLCHMLLLGIPDYIWNTTLYRIAICVVPWLVAIPAIINCVERKVSLRVLLGEHPIWQMLVGTGIGTGLAGVWLVIYYFMSEGNMAQFYTKDYGILLFYLLRYLFVVGASEELIFRVAIMGELSEHMMKKKWLAPLAANTLFALGHVFQTSLFNVAFAFVVGGVYTLLYAKWKRCGYIMLLFVHGMFDFMVFFIPFLISCL